jgi:ribulose-5-phosphate 4-epimerase/fuculose-1-phosphate aldolase
MHCKSVSQLVKNYFDGRIIDGPDGNLNSTIVRAGYIIHNAVLKAREDVFCELHTHIPAGTALSAMEYRLLPITQRSLRYYNRIPCHDYLGLEVDTDRYGALVADL